MHHSIDLLGTDKPAAALHFLVDGERNRAEVTAAGSLPFLGVRHSVISMELMLHS